MTMAFCCHSSFYLSSTIRFYYRLDHIKRIRQNESLKIVKSYLKILITYQNSFWLCCSMFWSSPHPRRTLTLARGSRSSSITAPAFQLYLNLGVAWIEKRFRTISLLWGGAQKQSRRMATRRWILGLLPLRTLRTTSEHSPIVRYTLLDPILDRPWNHDCNPGGSNCTRNLRTSRRPRISCPVQRSQPYFPLWFRAYFQYPHERLHRSSAIWHTLCLERVLPRVLRSGIGRICSEPLTVGP